MQKKTIKKGLSDFATLDTAKNQFVFSSHSTFHNTFKEVAGCNSRKYLK